MTSPASAEPTEAELARTIRGVIAFGTGGGYSQDATSTTLAMWVLDLLASQRAEIVARYEAVATTAIRDAYAIGTEAGSSDRFDLEQIEYLIDRIAHVREAAPK